MVHLAETLLPSFALAVMVAVPSLTAVTSPFASTVAMFSSEEVHARLLFVAFSGATLAFNANVSPSVSVCSVALSVMPSTSTTGAFTFMVHLAETLLPSVALTVMVAVPSLTAVTSPFASTVAMFSSEEVHARLLFDALAGSTLAVRFTVSPSSRVFSVIFSVMDATGMIDTFTVHVAFKFEPSLVVAVMVAVPSLIAVTTPSAFTVAMLLSEELQVTDRSSASSGVTVAVNWAVSVSRRDKDVLFRAIPVARAEA